METISVAEIYKYLENVFDPEVPVLTVLDLGVVRKILIGKDGSIEVIITPTYSGCPAMSIIAVNIKMELLSRGLYNIKVTQVLSPAWTTDWMSEAGKQKLKDYGIAPPQYTIAENGLNTKTVPCPLCNSQNTEVISEYASTACKSMYKCKECLEAFDYFKCH
jgi:ring-1,2-phenylacetyl-CoA epoxidase subunit PaaD